MPVMGRLLSNRRRAGSSVGKLAESGKLKELDALGRRLIATAIQTTSDESQPTSARTDSIAALAWGSLGDVEPTLVALIDTRQPGQVQKAAITTLGTFNSPRVAPPLLAAWPRLSPQLREAATDVLMTRTDRTLALFDAIDAGTLSLADLSKQRLQIAAKSKNAEVKKRAASYLASSGSARRGDIVESYRASLELSGDLERGKKLFQKQCAVCHKVEGVGHEIGPNLATIKTRGPETILVNVLDPNREVNPLYLNYIAVTLDGRTVTGMIAGENASSVSLRRAEAVTDTVLRDEIEHLQSTGLSIMPEGMEETIDKQAMADLIAYLMQVK